MSSHVFLLFPPHRHKPPPPVRDRLNSYPCIQRRRFPAPRYAKCPDVALNTIDPRHLRTAPSRFPNTIRFGNHPPLIQTSVPTLKSISCARLYEVIPWSGLSLCPDGAKQDPVVYGAEFGAVFLAKGSCTASTHEVHCLDLYHSGLDVS